MNTSSPHRRIGDATSKLSLAVREGLAEKQPHALASSCAAAPLLSRRSFLAAAGLTLAAFAAPSLAGCSNGGASSGSEDGKTQITVAYVASGYPTSYTDDAGEPDGYEVDVVRAVSEILADKYTFKFEGVDQLAVFAGLASGKYDQGLTNSFWTPERAEKYLQPEENIGATVLGILIRKEYSNISSLREAAEAGLKLAPIVAGDGNYYVVEDYNEKNPDAPIEIPATDDANAFTEAFEWVAQGRYDFHLTPLQYYNGLVVEDGAAYGQYADDLDFIIIGGTKTWSFMKQGNDEYAADWSQAITQLKEAGTLVELSEKWYDGVNNFEYITDDTQTYNFL